jgi:hypothetical protein
MVLTENYNADNLLLFKKAMLCQTDFLNVQEHGSHGHVEIYNDVWFNVIH